MRMAPDTSYDEPASGMCVQYRATYSILSRSFVMDGTSAQSFGDNTPLWEGEQP